MFGFCYWIRRAVLVVDESRAMGTVGSLADSAVRSQDLADKEISRSGG